ncbi:hypothetical protein JL721_10677 [Aureococcus anophagefferens]|nr:hypothetical protein JL721_10677 [Aureococcus anophagefferens]
MDGLDGVSAFEDASVQNAVRDLAAAEAFDDDAAAFDDDAAPRRRPASLRLVVAPRESQADTLERLKEWDLWGPLAVCLLLGVALSASAPEAQGGLAFAAAFVVVWLGAAA